MRFVAKLFMICLGYTFTVHADLSWRECQGLYDSIKWKYSDFSPLFGAMFMHSDALSNLYHMGYKSDKTIKLIRALFLEDNESIKVGESAYLAFIDAQAIAQALVWLNTHRSKEAIEQTKSSFQKKFITGVLERSEPRLGNKKMLVRGGMKIIFDLIIGAALEALPNDPDARYIPQFAQWIMLAFLWKKADSKQLLVDYLVAVEQELGVQDLFLEDQSNLVQSKYTKKEMDRMCDDGLLDLSNFQQLTACFMYGSKLNADDDLIRVYWDLGPKGIISFMCSDVSSYEKVPKVISGVPAYTFLLAMDKKSQYGDPEIAQALRINNFLKLLIEFDAFINVLSPEQQQYMKNWILQLLESVGDIDGYEAWINMVSLVRDNLWLDLVKQHFYHSILKDDHDSNYWSSKQHPMNNIVKALIQFLLMQYHQPLKYDLVIDIMNMLWECVPFMPDILKIEVIDALQKKLYTQSVVIDVELYLFTQLDQPFINKDTEKELEKVMINFSKKISTYFAQLSFLKQRAVDQYKQHIEYLRKLGGVFPMWFACLFSIVVLKLEWQDLYPELRLFFNSPQLRNIIRATSSEQALKVSLKYPLVMLLIGLVREHSNFEERNDDVSIKMQVEIEDLLNIVPERMRTIVCEEIRGNWPELLNKDGFIQDYCSLEPSQRAKRARSDEGTLPLSKKRRTK